MRLFVACAWLLAAGSARAGDCVTPECPQACPSGSHAVDYEQVIAGEAALVVSADCEAACQPEPACVPPAIAVASGGAIGCVAPEGHAALPPAAAVDLGFAVGWDPAHARPPFPGCTSTDAALGCAGLGAPVELFPESPPEAVRIGDVTGDGVADLVLAIAAPPGVVVLPAIGDGTFGPERWYQVRDTPLDLEIALVDGDAAADVVVALATEVSVLLAASDGTLGEPQYLATGGTPLAVAARQNEVVAALGDSGVAVVDAGAGGFAEPRIFDLGDRVLGVGFSAAGIAAVARGGVWQIARSGAGFAAPESVMSVAAACARVLALDGDALPDLVLGAEGTPRVLLLVGHPADVFATLRSIDVAAAPVRAVAAGALAGAAALDVAALGGTTLSIVLDAADAGARLDFEVGADFASVTLGDLDGDARSDVAIAGGGRLALLLTNGGGAR